MDGRRFCCACGQPLEVIQRKHEDEKVRPTSATKEIFFFYLCIRKTVLLSYVTLYMVEILFGDRAVICQVLLTEA